MSHAFSPHKYLVIGGSGFVGSHMVRFLAEQNVEVHYTYRSTIRDNLSSIDKRCAHQIDVNQQYALHDLIDQLRPQTIYNFAQTSYYRSPLHHESIKNPFWSLSFLDSLTTLAALYSFNIIHACSSTVYGDHGPVPLVESFNLEPLSERGIIKLLERDYLKYSIKAKNIHVVLGRIFRAYGPYDKPSKLINQIIENYKTRTPIPLVSDEFTRDYIYIRDLCEAFWIMSRSHLPSGVEINIGSGIPRKVTEIVEQLERILSTKLPVSAESYAPSAIDIKYYCADIRRAQSLLNWHPTTSLEYGLEEIVKIHI